jgi:hypothetical protein
MILKTYLLLLIILLPLFLSPMVFADSITDKQNDILVNAREALTTGNSKLSMRILKQNLSKTNFHLDSYLFLANYHFDNKIFSKGFKVYHYIIKILHTKKLVSSPKITDIETICDQVAKPSEEALEIYARLGQKYFELADSDVFTEEFSNFLSLRSLKYYKIINYYKYSEAETKYMLAVLHNRLENFQISYDNLLDSKDSYLDSLDVESKSQVENINYMLGDNLIRSGFSDAGALYLNSILSSPSSSKSLKEYASSYLDSLSDSFLSFAVTIEKTYNNNINRLTNSSFELFDDYSSILISKADWSEVLSFNAFYNSKKHGHWSYFIYGDFKNETMSNKALSDKDSRTFSTSFEAKYDNFKKTILKLNLSWNYSYYKESANLSFSKYSNLFSIAPSLVYMTTRGSLTAKGSLAITDSISGEVLAERTVSITYQPFWKSRWFSFSYSLEYGKVQEESKAQASKKYYLSFSNFSTVSDNHSLFFSFYLTTNNNKRASLAYRELNLSFSHSYLVPWINGLTLGLNANYEYNIPRSSDKVRVLEYGASLSYNF